MKRIILISIIVLPSLCAAQVNLKDIRKASWETMVYRISAVDAIQYEKWDSIPVNKFLQLPPVGVFKSSSWFEDSLAIGFYVFISVQDNKLKAELYNRSELLILAVNNKQRLQLDVRTKAGIAVQGASIFVHGKKAQQNTSAGTFWVSRKIPEDAIVIVNSPGDTLITSISAQNDAWPSVSQQRKRNYRNTKLYKLLNFLPDKFTSIIQHRRKSSRLGAAGFMVFNQPKYKPLDTVKLKAYVLNKHWKQYSKQIELFLNYNIMGKNYNLPLGKIKPVSAGAYTHEFVLADSIPSDIQCTVNFKTTSGKFIISRNFKIEDYVPDEIGVQEFRSEKKEYFRNDSLRFYASAKDANGLNIMDASARLILLSGKINNFYQDTLFVADTLLDIQKKLLVDGETAFTITSALLPAADLDIKAKLIFKNGNNELQEKEETVRFRSESKMIFVSQIRDSLKAVLMENGKEITGVGEMAMNYDDEVPISYPFAIKIDPLAEHYAFYMNDEKDSLREIFDVGKSYEVSFSRISKEDTLGFVLSNPYKIPVYFTVLNGRDIIDAGKGSGEIISWNMIMKNRRQMYKVRWQYYWAGEERFKEESLGLLYKLLKINIDNKNRIFPGQDDSLKITVTDYKNRPAANVNLTALSYNNQLRKDIKVNDPPYLVRYKSKKYINRDGFDADESEPEILTKLYLLGKNIEWKSKFGLDTMEYYKLLFPTEGVFDATRHISTFMPQVSVNVVKDGVPQEIYLLYINRQLVYYNAVTDPMSYAFEVYPQNLQLNIRLNDKLIQIDSLYLQPNYKHDLSFDLNNLPKNSRVYATDNSWTYPEKQLLENSIWRMQNDEENNESFLWQGNSFVKLAGRREHSAGPFLQYDSMTFYNPSSFDIRFKFEPGYEYKLSKQVLRLEKKQLFPWRKQPYLLPIKTGSLLLGDTLAAIPSIAYQPAARPIRFKLSKDAYKYYYESSPGSNKGKINLKLAKTTRLEYVIFDNIDSSYDLLTLSGNMNSFNNLDAGHYLLVLVTDSGKVSSKEIVVYAGGTECINMQNAVFKKNDSLLNGIVNKHYVNEQPVKPIVLPKEPVHYVADSIIFIAAGGGSVTGIITDAKGKNPVIGCSITIKGSRAGTYTNSTGEYLLNNLRPGKYTLVISAVGYNSIEKSITIAANFSARLDGSLSLSSNSLNEVVVVGYGATKKSIIVSSISSVRGEELSNYANALMGKAPGINVQSSELEVTYKIRLRGISSFNANNNPIYVVDGILYDDPQNIDPSLIADITVLQSSAGTAIYGSRAANGVIVINTKIKTQRTDFKDYAFWKPNFFTDKEGKAAVHVKYPDNVTGWQTYVLAFDKKRRMGKASVFTQSYKPMLAQLNLPLFLIEGDSSYFITKSINYTADKYSVKTSFTVNGLVMAKREKDLLPNDASVVTELVSANNGDSLKASFGIESTTGFKDMEERKIPIFKKGIEEKAGNFWILQGDTTVTFNAEPGSSSLNLYAQNNTLDLMLEELENLKRYPYYCMEQISSKITGLVLERKIKQQLNQSFKGQRELDILLKKIQKSQQFDGGWAWWENGKSNLYITSYITNSLLLFRDNPLVEANIRNAFLFLQNKLPSMNKSELLNSLLTLSNGKHEMDYSIFMNKINFDSLSEHQQWEWVKIKQQQNLPHQAELKKLMSSSTSTMLGALHWGKENYSWHSNEVATTTIAFEVLNNEPEYKNLQPSIIQFFLQKKSGGYWRNTVETARILSAILPSILATQKDFQNPAVIKVSGDTSFTINNFPFQLKMNNASFKNIVIEKQGGGMVYFTAWQRFFNKNPLPVEDKFLVKTSFMKNGQPVAALRSGERVKMIVKIEVLKDAEFVMLEASIPAGCIFSNKTNNDWKVFKEFQKDKLLLFAEALNKGIHEFEVELEPRYNGIYTLNPAKIELMYYPTFFGRNERRKIVVE